MIYKYLLEIRHRAFFCFIAWSFLMLNCYFFKETLLYTFLKLNPIHTDEGTVYFLITNITEVFITYLQLTCFITNQITFMFICYQFFAFISTGLFTFEYVYFKNTCLTVAVCWVLCILLLNGTVFPSCWNYFLQFQNFILAQNLTFYFEAKLSEYWAFYLTIYYVWCFAYQFIVFFWIFLSLSTTNLSIIKRLRKVLYFVFFIVATLITPPNVEHQLFTSICIIMIYELILIHLLFKIELLYSK
jgi:sec-independent protein translocase protein TatC